MILRYELKGLDEIIQSLQPSLAARTTMRTLNKVGAMAITAGKRRITNLYTIKYGDIKATGIKATLTSGEFVIQVKGGRRQMSKSKYFKARQTPTGVVVEIQKGKPEFIPHAFIAQHTQGGTNVYLRNNSSSRRVKKISSDGKVYYSQLPITASLGPSPANLFRTKDVHVAIQSTVHTEFERIFRSQLSYELSQTYRKNIKTGKGA